MKDICAFMLVSLCPNRLVSEPNEQGMYAASCESSSALQPAESDDDQKGNLNQSLIQPAPIHAWNPSMAFRNWVRRFG
jgi:hypothetical protein